MSKLILIPGAPKCGTTSLHSLIAESVGCDVASLVKEPHFLLGGSVSKHVATRSVQAWDAYKKSISVTPDLAVDASQSYYTEALDTSRVSLLQAQWETIEIVIIVRDPVARLISAYSMDKANGWVSESLEVILRSELSGQRNEYGCGPRYLAESQYYANFRRLRTLFPDARFHVIEFKALMDSKGRESILSVLGLPLEGAANAPHKNSKPDGFRPIWLTKILSIPLLFRIAQRIPNSVKVFLRSRLYVNEAIPADVPEDIKRALAIEYEKMAPNIEILASTGSSA